MNIAFLVLISSAHGLIIGCNYRNLTWTIVGTRYTCHMSVIDSSNPTTLTDVLGFHTGGKRHEDVEGLYVQPELVLTRLPKNIEKFFPNLVMISWIDGVLNHVSAEDLKPFPKIRFLDFFNSNLESLDGDLFQHSQELQHINFGRNAIEFVGNGLLTGLDNLVNAGFHDNKCIDLNAENVLAMQELKLQLATKCSLISSESTTISTTSETSECSVRCSINDETDQLKLELSELRQRVDALERRREE